MASHENFLYHSRRLAMAERIEFPDPEVRPPEYRVPRGRSGVGSETALETLLSDLERIRRAKESWGEPAERPESWQFRF